MEVAKDVFFPAVHQVSFQDTLIASLMGVENNALNRLVQKVLKREASAVDMG